jgi:hypothetical protein
MVVRDSECGIVVPAPVLLWECRKGWMASLVGQSVWLVVGVFCLIESVFSLKQEARSASFSLWKEECGWVAEIDTGDKFGKNYYRKYKNDVIGLLGKVVCPVEIVSQEHVVDQAALVGFPAWIGTWRWHLAGFIRTMQRDSNR